VETFSRTITVNASTTAKLVFDHSEVITTAFLLDNVSLAGAGRKIRLRSRRVAERTGTINGNVTNSGQLTAGNPTGSLAIYGSYEQAANGILNTEIGGITPVRSSTSSISAMGQVSRGR